MKQPVPHAEQRILIVVVSCPVEIVVVQNGTYSLGQIVIVIGHRDVLVVVGQGHGGSDVYLRHLGYEARLLRGGGNPRGQNVTSSQCE